VNLLITSCRSQFTNYYLREIDADIYWLSLSPTKTEFVMQATSTLLTPLTLLQTQHEFKIQDYEIRFSVSSPSTCSTSAPTVIEYETSTTVELEMASSPKRRRVDHTAARPQGQPYEEDIDYDEKRKLPKGPKQATKKVPVICECSACGTTTNKSFSVRNDSLWLYAVIFPGKDLTSKDRLCTDCQHRFKNCPCAHCHNAGAAYWLPPTKIKDACKAFNVNDLAPGRLCYACGDKLSKFMKKK
jgi:ribosomal protein L44E